MSGLGPARDGAALRVPTASGRRERAAWSRKLTKADIWPFALALLVPSAAALVAAGFQSSFASWPEWLSRTLTGFSLAGLVVALFLQLRKQQAGTLYAIEALDQKMLSWHRSAELATQPKRLDYRPIYRPLTFPPGNGLVDLTAEMEELRRSVEFARQTDDESTGMTVAPNLLWPAAMYLGFMTPFPPGTRLIEFADAPKHQDFELSRIEGSSPAFRETADCGCVVEVVADDVDPTTGERQEPSGSGGCIDGRVKVLSIEVSGMLDWPGPSIPGVTPCCATRLSIRITAPCDAHAESFCSIQFASSRGPSILEKQSVNAKNTPVQVPSDQAMSISAWLSERLLEACLDKSHQVLVRARLPKVMGLSLGAHLRGHAALTRSRHGTEDVWGNLLLVDHPHPAPPRLVRVHPCQPVPPTLNEVELE